MQKAATVKNKPQTCESGGAIVALRQTQIKGTAGASQTANAIMLITLKFGKWSSG